MRYGLINDEKIEATQTGQRAICPCCKTELLSRCGEFKVNHWAHVNLLECDSWQGSKTDWHIDWQDQFPKECQEVVYTDERTGEKHIADVSYNDFIFEFQHSGISFEEILARSNFYMRDVEKKMVWVFDFNNKEEHFEFYHWKLSNVARITKWRWKPEYISIMQDWSLLVLIDVGDELWLLLWDGLCIKIENIKEIVTTEFKNKLFNLQKQIYKDALTTSQKDRILFLEQEKWALESNSKRLLDDNINLKAELCMSRDSFNVIDYEHKGLSRLYDDLQIQNRILQDENESLKKKLSASTNLFSYS